MVFSEKYFVDPTGRQNFSDAPGQIPKLILTLCHMSSSLVDLVRPNKEEPFSRPFMGLLKIQCMAAPGPYETQEC